MKLFKLPFLCQKEVFTEMHFSTRYTFTFGTRRMKIWAKRLQNTSKSAEVQLEIGEVVAGVAFFVDSDGRVEKIMDLARRRLDPDESIVMKFSDLELQCEVSYSPTILLKHNQRISPTTRILESLCEFFNTTKPEIVFYLNNLHNIEYLPPIAIRKSVLRLSNWHQNLRYMDQFYSDYPVQHFSMIQVRTDVINFFPQDFRMLRTRNLILSSIGHLDISILTGFQGENLAICGRSIQNSVIKQFLRIWLRRNSDDLKTVIVEVTDPIQGDDIFGEIPHIKGEKGVRYPYSSIIQEYHDFPEDAFDCSNTYSITRNTGDYNEKKATVKMTPNSFMILVWD